MQDRSEGIIQKDAQWGKRKLKIFLKDFQNMGEKYFQNCGIWSLKIISFIKVYIVKINFLGTWKLTTSLQQSKGYCSRKQLHLSSNYEPCDALICSSLICISSTMVAMKANSLTTVIGVKTRTLENLKDRQIWTCLKVPYAENCQYLNIC